METEIWGAVVVGGNVGDVVVGVDVAGVVVGSSFTGGIKIKITFTMQNPVNTTR